MKNFCLYILPLSIANQSPCQYTNFCRNMLTVFTFGHFESAILEIRIMISNRNPNAVEFKKKFCCYFLLYNNKFADFLWRKSRFLLSSVTKSWEINKKKKNLFILFQMIQWWVTTVTTEQLFSTRFRRFHTNSSSRV